MTIRTKNKRESGFSLIELLLVLGIVSVAMIGVISYITRVSEQMTAESAGQQFADIGKALGNYISRESGNLNSCIPAGSSISGIPLTVLTQSAGTTTVGPCVLNNRQVLPSTTNNTNLWGSGYNIGIENTASGSLGGLVMTSSPVYDPAYGSQNIVRYDWMGMAMKKAGAQSGMTFTATGPNALTGLGAGWTLTNADFAAINTLGLFGYRVSYQGTYDDIYLRLDGAYPMRGNLNMGNYNINNATDINFNGWLNGNNALLNNLKTGYISNSGNIQTNTATVTSSIATGGRETSPMPGGWGGDHIHTWDVYAEGSVGSGTGGALQAYMNNTGAIVGKDIYINGGLNGSNGRNGMVYGWLSDRLPQYVSRGATVVWDGAGIGKPNCTASGGNGSAKILVIPQIQNTYGNYNVTVTLQPQANNSFNMYVNRTPYTFDQIQVYAVDMGTWWQVRITSWTAQQYGAATGYMGVAEVFCDYGA